MSRPSREQQVLQEALPAYELTGEIGRGAFGVVYGGRHTQLGREVAIKQLPRAFAADPAVRERFVAEARMVASLDHPHIVPVYDFVDRDDGICLLIMERCQGALSDRFVADGLATDEACAAVLACCAALDFAHQRGLLHRDIKPENLMFDARGTVKLADFGIARALDSDARRTATGMIIGTPAYMSPEQVRGDELTPASDVYSVGVMTYELLTGALPYPEAGTATALLAHHLVTEPTPLTITKPELPAAIGAVVDRALSKDLAVRHSSALEFATELTRACVQSFGAGWLRRRRFSLLWPEVLAESERADADGVRTGTILVKADPHRERLIGAPDTSVATPPEPTSPRMPTTQRRSRLLIGGGVAAAAALVVGVLVVTGGDNSTSSGSTTVAVTATVADTSAAAVATVAPDPSLSTRPAGLDMTVASSPWSPTPCPTDQPRVACIIEGVTVDEASGELSAPYFTEGFTPELEPAGHHLAFFLDTAVDGDENKAGVGAAGGSWKQWDGPGPFTSAGGENGRTGFTIDDVQAAGARHLCVVVATPDQLAVPGSGNCAPIPQTFDPAALLVQTNRLTGTYIGSCGLGATLIVPSEWQWADLVAAPPAEAAAALRPAQVEQMTTILQSLVELGGVMWAEGPVIDGYIVNLTVIVVEADVSLTSTPDEVAAALALQGISTERRSDRIVGGQPVLSQAFDLADSSSVTYMIPDHGSIVAVTVSAPDAATASQLGDPIAATVLGC